MAGIPLDPAPPQARPDTLLGVCAAIAEICHVPALAIRIGFVLAMLGLSFELTIAAYLILGIAVAASRFGTQGDSGTMR